MTNQQSNLTVEQLTEMNKNLSQAYLTNLVELKKISQFVVRNHIGQCAPNTEEYMTALETITSIENLAKHHNLKL